LFSIESPLVFAAFLEELPSIKPELLDSTELENFLNWVRERFLDDKHVKKALKRLIFKLKNKNDDAILRAVARELEQEGFRVVAANNFVPELIALSGQLSKRKPSAKEIQDILFAWPLVKKLGELDIGQCIVVRDQMVVAVESIEGTNATILRAGQLAGKGCVVVKAFKPGQDSRIDIPALGSKTIEVMAQAGATCLAYEAGKSLFFELDRAISLADKNKIAVIGIDEQLLQRLKSLSDGKKKHLSFKR